MTAHDPPILGEPLPIEFANTRFAHRGKEIEGLQTPEDLTGWLGRVRDQLPLAPDARGLDAITPMDLASAHELRDALRTLLADVTAGAALDAGAAETLNKIMRAAPRWHELSVAPELAAVTRTAARPAVAAFAAIAEQAVWLLTGPDTAALCACQAPGCMLFYRKDHPRRAWCSPRCSNRVRSARHYARHRAASEGMRT